MNKKTSEGKVLAISVSSRRGVRKTNVVSAELKEDFGIVGDAHAGPGELRQVSLLANESIEAMKRHGLSVRSGDFAENLTTSGMDLMKLRVGQKLKIGKDVILEISQIGKDCHRGCEIRSLTGDCLMPREGIFCRVLKGGIIHPGDTLNL